jgi:predicted amidohydrolase YtcJ
MLPIGGGLPTHLMKGRSLVTADLTLLNGNVLTMDEARPRASAVAIREGMIVAVGSDDEARSASCPKAELIDLNGRTATPGLIDAHAHPAAVGFALADLDLSPPPNQSIADLMELVRQRASEYPTGTWIVGRGYDQSRLADQRHPTKEDLDAVAPDHPVLLIRACHHIGVVNSQALKLAGISATTPDPPGGAIDRDSNGKPTGVLRESAYEHVRTVIGPPSEDQIMEALLLGGKEFLASGVTSVTDALVHRPEELRAYQRLRRAQQLPFRAYLMMIIDNTLDELIELGIQTGFGDSWLRIGPAKLFSDGTIGGRTARMRHPYVGSSEEVGLWMLPPDEIMTRVARAHDAGFQVGIHAIGDAAIDLILDAYEAAQRANPRQDARHRIEHCSILDEDTIERIARLGVIPIPGTSFLYYFREGYVQNLGLDRLRYTYAMASFDRHGVIAAASTDAPIVPTGATIGLQTMMTRTDIEGTPIWPEESVSLMQALRAYTVNGAYASFEEGIKGRLVPGLVGDVTVFETNLEQTAPVDIGAVQIDYTIADGSVVYSRA